jgi:CPA1 family monovalent cation:H+ antiporter
MRIVELVKLRLSRWCFTRKRCCRCALPAHSILALRIFQTIICASMTGVVEIFVSMLLVVAALALLARKLHIPYPILFVVAGLLLGFLPGIPRVHLNPELVFVFFLPPLLYPAALFTSWRDFRMNLRPILLLAIGLVLMTTACIALLTHHFIGLPLAAGFVLGAIISPPDAIAATAIAENLRVPRRIITVLEGESLVNDASALVAYRFGVMAVVTGSFSLAHASLKFFIVGIGGILVGLIIGWLAEQFHRRVVDAPIEITVSLLTPFAAYLPAEALGVSGVLAVVTAGLYLGWRLPEITDFQTRLDARPVWDTVEFMLNGCVFILIGLQLPDVLHATLQGSVSAGQLIKDALFISIAVIVVRIIWVFPASYLPRLLSKNIRTRDPYPSWRHVAVVSWTGMRGVVSLAAALALPLTTHSGAPFPDRDLIVFLSFVVILATLVVQGLSLPLLIRGLHIEADDSLEHEEREARLAANKAALASLKEAAERDPTKTDAAKRLRIEYEDRIRQLEATEPDHVKRHLRLFSNEYERLSRETLNQERHTILQLRNKQVINDEVLRRIQLDIDLAEARLRHDE